MRDDYHTRHRIAPLGGTRIGPNSELRTASAGREHSIPRSWPKAPAGFASRISATRPGCSPAVELHNVAGSTRQQAPIEAASCCRVHCSRSCEALGRLVPAMKKASVN